MTSNIVFMSHVLDETTPVYGNRQGFRKEKSGPISVTGRANSMSVSFPNHLGTHIDFPKHFFDDGATAEHYAADFWFFKKPLKVTCPKEDSGLIEISDLEPQLGHNRDFDCLMIQTGFERFREEERYWSANPGLSEEVGIWLRNEFPGLRVLGVDTISISRWQDRETGRKAHRALLRHDNSFEGRAGILILEDVSFKNVPEDSKLESLWIAPLRIEGADGSPCTIIAKVTK